MRRVAVGLGAALALSACGDEVGVLSLGGLEDSLVALARVTADGTVRETRLVDPRAASYFGAEDGEAVLAFHLPAALLQGPEGRPLSTEERAELKIAEGSASGQCSVCAYPSETAPFVLDRGNRCTLPPFFEQRMVGLEGEPAFSEEALASIRGNIHVERPGECGCLSERTGLVRDGFSSCEVEPGPKPHRWHRLAVSDSGSIAAIHPSMALTASISGSAQFHPVEPTFIRSPVLAEIAGGRFFASSRIISSISDIADQRFIRFDGETTASFDPIEEVGALVTAAIYDRTRGAVFLIGIAGRVWRCDEDMTRCTGTTLPSCILGEEMPIWLSNVTTSSTGDLLGITSEANLLRLPAGSDEWECRLSDPTLLEREGPAALVEDYAESLIVGDRVFTCGHASTDTHAPDDLWAAMLSTELSLNATRWHAGAIRLHLEEMLNARCQGLWHDRERGEVLAFFYDELGTQILAFGTDGAYLGKREDRFPELSEPLAMVRESTDGRSRLIAGAHGTLLIRRDNATPLSLGPVPTNRPAFALRGAQDTLVLGGEGPVSWDGECTANSLEPRAPLDLPLQAAARLPDERAVAIAAGEVVIYDASDGIVDRFAAATTNIVAAAAITEEHVVLLDRDGRAHALSLSQRQIAPLVLWTGPNVPSTQDLRFEHLTGARGLGWLSGGENLARVRVTPEGLVGELWWGPRILQKLMTGSDALEIAAYGSPSVLCAGRAMIFVRVIQRNIDGNQYLGRSVLLEPSANAQDYEVRALPGFSDQARFGASSFKALARQSSAGENAVLGFGDGLILRPDSKPWYMPNGQLTSIVEMGDQAVLTDRAGLRVFLRSP